MRIILFDGVCNFCDASVQFIMKRDGGAFRFASLQSDIGQQYVEQFHIAGDSVVLIDNDQAYTKSTAALRIALRLGFPWRLFGLALLVPPRLRDLAYTWFAKHRYRIFGQKNTCMLPTADQRARFLS